MGRFDRHEGPGSSQPPLDTATAALHATVEDKLREIVEAAEAQAHEIEDRALEQALDIEQDSERRAQELFASSSDGAEQLLGAIDAFEHQIAEALAVLRRHSEALASELDSALGVEEEPDEQQQEQQEQQQPEQAQPEPPQPAPEPPQPAPPALDAPTLDDAREGVRKRILDLFLAGKPRRDAEFMLAQIDDSDRYTDLLDEVYESHSETQQGSSSRRGGRRRRRPGTP